MNGIERGSSRSARLLLGQRGGPKGTGMVRWRISRRLGPSGLVCLVVALAAACAVIGTENRPAPGGIYREALVGQPLSLNPLLHPHDPVTNDLSRLVHAGLVRVVDGGRIEPDLATGWESSENGLTYTFRLRPDGTWQDGRPITSADVVFTVAQLQSPAYSGPRELANTWRGIQAEAISRDVVRFILAEPLAGFIEACSLPLLAQHVFDTGPVGLADHPASYAPVGAGPYLVRHFSAEGAVLVRHPGYITTRPLLDEIDLRFFPDRAAAAGAFMEGAVDGFAGLRGADLSGATGAERVATYAATVHGYQSVLLINHGSPVLADPVVRRALAAAIDRRAIASGPLRGESVPAYGPIAASSWAYDAAVEAPLDRIMAQRLLDDAGWAGAPVRARAGRLLRLRLSVPSVATEIAVAELLATELREIGFQIDVQPTYLPDLVRDRLRPADFELALVGMWLGSSDPDPYAVWHSSQALGGFNFGRYASLAVDQLLLSGHINGDLDRRRTALVAFQQRWLDETPAIVLTNPLLTIGLTNQILGVRIGTLNEPSDRFQHLAEWHLRTQRVPALPR